MAREAALIEERVLAELSGGPASGGRIVERLQAAGEPALAGRFALVFGALFRLAARGEIALLSESEGEALWGLPGAPPPPPRPPGFPPSFALQSANDIALVDREVAGMTRDMPPWTFEEIRRAVVADAERRVFHGEKLPRAIHLALQEIGPAAAVRKLLRDGLRGREVRLRLRAPRPGRWIVPCAGAVLLVLLRLFVLGVYVVPSNSMAPALAAADEGGDARVLANLLAFAGRPPSRGDVVVVRVPGEERRLVKRVMGLPGEEISIAGGDLHLGGVRLRKERDLLDRVKAPLYLLADFEETRNPRGFRQREPLNGGYRWPDGRREPGRDPVPEAVVVAKVRARSAPSTVTLTLDDGLPARHVVVLSTAVYGAGASCAGREVAGGPAFLLKPGGWREVWMTNADRCFRVEIDGVEVARAEVPNYGESARLEVALEGGAEVAGLEVARDAIYLQREGGPNSWKLGPREVLLLGDNSAQSRDSRFFGPAALDWILGRVFAVAWPPSRIRLLP